MRFIVNINAWKNKTQKQKDRIKSSATDYVRGRVLLVYKEAVRVSPQWSGNFAYNWQIEFTGFTGGRYDPRFKVDPWFSLRGHEKKAGDPEALVAGLGFIKSQLEYIKWNSKIKLVNYAPVADLIEDGKVELRPENLIPGNQGVISYLGTKFAYLKA